MTTDPAASPLNPLPGGVWILVLAIAGAELAFAAGAAGLIGGPEAIGWRLQAVQRLGFSGSLFEWMLENRRYPPEHLLRLVTYAFVHASWLHALFVVVFVVALGKFVGDGMRSLAVLTVFLGASIAGALAWGLAFASPYWLLGGYPGVFGLVGAFTYLLWTDLGRQGANRIRAFALVGVLLAIRLAIGLYEGAGGDWLADLAGFGAGFGLSFLVAPGGWRRLVQGLRQR
jgi:membrane associated rhomboid family serine protease